MLKVLGTNWVQTKQTKQTDGDDDGDGIEDNGDGDDGVGESFGGKLGANKGDKTNS